MKFHHQSAGIYVPDDAPLEQALKRITHLGIGAHHDDLEFMAFHGIIQCFHSDEQWFGGVTCTNGAGSPRTGVYAGCSDAQMQMIRCREQNAAALLGRYGVMIQLDYPSTSVQRRDSSLRGDLTRLLQAASPHVVYTHNPADKHDTHVGVMMAVIDAIRQLPPAERPAQLLGCEVWRDLDWMLDQEKIALDVSNHENLAAALNGLFDSQIAGGKRYDLAVAGRRRANATFFDSHSADQSREVTLAMDLTPLIQNDALSVEEYVCGFAERFLNDVREKIRKVTR
jgi:LmbE family N-acetylglucosaminyl deacetylase